MNAKNVIIAKEIIYKRNNTVFKNKSHVFRSLQYVSDNE